jgi:hypothetical protein
MERKAATAVITKAASTEEPKWTTMMAKNVRQVVNQAMETGGAQNQPTPHEF